MLCVYSENNIKKRTQKGFSLVEMAVVTSVIGVIIAGVVGGEKLYQASKLRRLTTEIVQYSTAINTFKEEYGYYPGDFPQAIDFWTAAPRTNVTIRNGNGDGWVGFTQYTNSEDLNVWSQINESDLIPGSFTGVQDPAANTHYAASINLPMSIPFNNITFSFSTDNQYIYNSYAGSRLRITSLNDNGLPLGPDDSLSANEALSVDLKIDDGEADSGNLIGFQADTGGCTNNEIDDNNSQYDLDSDDEDCILEWYVNKF